MEQIILAIDPGKIKCGIAIVDNKLNFIAGRVVEKNDLVNEIIIFKEKYQIKEIAIGGGTASKNVFSAIKEHFPDLKLYKVIEKDTTMLARKRYFEFHPPKGLLRFLPLSLRIPPHPYDDLAALIIAERFFENYEDINDN